MMQLEDHIGDILRKAQVFLGCETNALVEASGLSAEEWDQLVKHGYVAVPSPQPIHWDPVGNLLGVESGLSAGEWRELIEKESPGARPLVEPDWEALGRLLGIDGGLLRSIAEGWTPCLEEGSNICEGGRWIQSSGETLFMGEPLLNTVNGYLFWDPEKKEAGLFDPGWDIQNALEVIRKEELQLSYIFVTHAHPDHVHALPRLRKEFSQAVVVDWKSCGEGAFSLGKVSVLPRKTPGHSRDHLIFEVSGFEKPLAVVGDCLFSGSLGYPFHNQEELVKSLRQIFSLPAETILCPGHGPLTSIQIEREHNPLLKLLNI